MNFGSDLKGDGSRINSYQDTLDSDNSAVSLEKDVRKPLSNTSMSSVSSMPPHGDELLSLPLKHAAMKAETDAQNPHFPSSTQSIAGVSIETGFSRPRSFEIDFGENDRDNPLSRPLWYRSLQVASTSFGVFTIVYHSTSYTKNLPGMIEEFHLKKQSIATLGITSYQIGIAIGSLFLAPLSEMFGRRPVFMGSTFIYLLLVISCGLARSLIQIIVSRFFGGFFGAVFFVNSHGTIADNFTQAKRAKVFSLWYVIPMFAPTMGPLIGGFVAQNLGWRWNNWLVLVFSLVALIWLSINKESYAPFILRKRVAKAKKETGDNRWWCRYDCKEKKSQMMKENLLRPILLASTEPFLWFWNIFIAVNYAVFYLSFLAFPIVFTKIRGWSPGFSGLAHLGIGLGSMLAIVSEPLLRRLINMHKVDPVSGKRPLEASIIVVCIASMLSPLGQFWFAWTSTPSSIHWIWSILAGIPFGAGNCLTLIYASGYLVNSYGIFAASAIASTQVSRNVMAGLLPLAGVPLYRALGPKYAGTLLGLIQASLIPIPFVFYKFGGKIRARSSVIRQSQKDQDQVEKKMAVTDAAATMKQKSLV